MAHGNNKRNYAHKIRSGRTLHEFNDAHSVLNGKGGKCVHHVRLLAALEADPVLVDELDDVSDDDDEAEADAELDEDDELVDEGVADDSLVPTAEADASALGLESEEADGRLVAVV